VLLAIDSEDAIGRRRRVSAEGSRHLLSAAGRALLTVLGSDGLPLGPTTVVSTNSSIALQNSAITYIDGDSASVGLPGFSTGPNDAI